jgi:hypothetical protein
MLSTKQLYNNTIVIKVDTCLLVAFVESYQLKKEKENK